MNDLYQEQIMDHYRSPRNKGVLDRPDASFEDQNPLCGDTIRVDLMYCPPPGDTDTDTVVPDDRRIAEIRFSGQGCAISQAAASMLTELVEGRTLAEAKAVTKEDLLDELGISLSATRLKCALLSLKVLKAALYGLGT